MPHIETVRQWFSQESLSAILPTGPQGHGQELALAVLSGPGKRLRPWMVAGMCEAFLGSVPDDFKKVAVAVECFHKASLIHDDIEDNDDLRYGLPTLHKKIGVPLAINVGDTLIHLGYELIWSCDITADTKIEMFGVATRSQSDMCAGQDIDLRGGISFLKTSALFYMALALSAVYAGFATRSVLWWWLSQFANDFGAAFQILDDSKDSLDPRHECFKALALDLASANAHGIPAPAAKFLQSCVEAITPKNPPPPPAGSDPPQSTIQS